MNKRNLGILVGVACAVVAVVVIWMTFFKSSDEQAIQAVLARLAKAVMVKEGDTVISRNARLKSELADIVSDDVRVDVTELHMGVTGRARFVEDATKAGLMYSKATVEWTNTRIKLDEGGSVAKVDATGLVTGDNGGQPRSDKRDVHFLLRKDDGKWRITTIDVAAPQNE